MTKPYLDPIREAQAVAALREWLASQKPEGEDEDYQLLLDCIEGETSFFEMADQLLEQIAEAEEMVKGVAALIDKLQTRKAMFAQHAANARTLLERAFEAADLKKLQRPGGTLSLRAGSPRVVVTDEAAIPERYWKQPPKVLDKRLLNEDLKDRRNAQLSGLKLGDIPGATLSNGPPSLAIR